MVQYGNLGGAFIEHSHKVEIFDNHCLRRILRVRLSDRIRKEYVAAVSVEFCFIEAKTHALAWPCLPKVRHVRGSHTSSP